VLTTRESLDGLALIQRHSAHVRVVVLDVRMPRVDGRWLFAEIRRLAPAARIIPYTADREAGAQLQELGSCPPLYKPVVPAAIVSAIEEALATPQRAPSTRLYTFLQEQAPWVIRHARADGAAPRVALLARSEALRAGLSALLARAGAEVAVATAQAEAVHPLAAGGSLQLIVCTPELLAAGQRLSLASQVPLLVYLFHEAEGDLDLPPGASLVVEPVNEGELAEALRTAASGGVYRSRAQPLAMLTPRQRRLVDLVAANRPVPAIAAALGITPSRVYHMLTELYRELDLDGIAALRAWAHAQLHEAADVSAR
jgi:DNA-binding NarL/FixJ family response regulator